MNRKTALSVLGMLLFAVSPSSAQDTVFFTDFDFGGAADFSFFEISELNDADNLVGEWTGDDFPEGDGSGFFTPDSTGIVDNPHGGTLLYIDRPIADATHFANLTNTVQTLGAEVSFLAGTRRTGGGGAKDYDIFGLDADGNESFRIRVGTDGSTERLGYVVGSDVFFDLPTVVGEDQPDDIANTGGPAFGTGDDIVNIAVRLGGSGYTVDLVNLNESNAYTTAVLPYNGPATELAQVGFFYQGVEGATGSQSGFFLDTIEVRGFDEVLQGDFDFNGVVDGADFTILADNFGTGTTVNEGDFNFDGNVDLVDFAGLKAAFNAAGGATAAAVPEPTTGLLSLVGGLGLGVLRRRRVRRASKQSKLAETRGRVRAGLSTWCLIIVCVGAVQLGLFSTARAETVLGTGTGALLGGDLTDPEDDGDPEADDGYNAIFDGNEEPGFAGGEFAFNVFDNVLGGGNDKWCCGAAGGFPEEGLWVEAQLQSPPAFLTHFTVSSANDTPGRDPTNWTISGSNDGTNYTNIYEYEGDSLWTERLQVIQFVAGEDFENQETSYQTFRFTAFDTVNNPTGAYFQIAEIEFFGDLKAVIPGDFNKDGAVDFSDATILADNFGTGSGFGQGDMNRDGIINLKDFVSFREVFLAEGQAATAAVPEPGTFTLLGLAGLLLLRFRRGRA